MTIQSELQVTNYDNIIRVKKKIMKSIKNKQN
jgi:hypothetical protein